MKHCATCAHWQGGATSYAAPCALLSYPGRVAFDQTCEKHSATPTQDQSNARGVPPMVQMWSKKP